MKIRPPIIFCLILAALMAVAHAEANTRAAGFATRKADRIEDQRFEKKMWDKSAPNAFSKKSFEIRQWDKHFTPLGGKKAPIRLTEDKKKAIFETKRLDRDVVVKEMSGWNKQMKQLHERAGIEMDDKAQLVADQQLYSMMLQDTQRFRDMAGELSLQDINRYQFRRNRPGDYIPVQQAGSGEE
jgi:hypothetical protein